MMRHDFTLSLEIYAPFAIRIHCAGTQYSLPSFIVPQCFHAAARKPNFRLVYACIAGLKTLKLQSSNEIR